MPYYKKIRLSDGEAVERKLSTSAPESEEGFEWEEIIDPETDNETYVEPGPKIYSAKEFLASCMMDSEAEPINMQTILDKLDAKQESRLITCLQFGNFEMLNALITQYVTDGVLTASDVAYFSEKILTEQGVTL